MVQCFLKWKDNEDERESGKGAQKAWQEAEAARAEGPII